MALLPYYQKKGIEAGCDEAGRGCLAGPVFAAAVILPKNFYHVHLNDSKKLSEQNRLELRPIIEENAIAFAVASMNSKQIDKYNILRSSIMSMHKALDQLTTRPTRILIDGNRFYAYQNISHHCIIKGDGIYASIAAASILAKTYRDDYMKKLHKKYPQYYWNQNKGYPTTDHREAITIHGISDYHRKSFRLLPDTLQLSLFEE